MDVTSIYLTIWLAIWGFAGLGALVWSSVNPSRHYARAVRRHDFALDLFIPWVLSGYLVTGLIFTLA